MITQNADYNRPRTEYKDLLEFAASYKKAKSKLREVLDEIDEKKFFVYHSVKTDRHSPASFAHVLGVHKSRISQICSDVAFKLAKKGLSL